MEDPEASGVLREARVDADLFEWIPFPSGRRVLAWSSTSLGYKIVGERSSPVPF